MSEPAFCGAALDQLGDEWGEGCTPAKSPVVACARQAAMPTIGLFREQYRSGLGRSPCARAGGAPKRLQLVRRFARSTDQG